MRVAASILAFAGVAVNAFPQAVTSAISPSAAAPSGCSVSYSSSFGLAVVTLGSASATSKAVATQSPDGQPAAGSSAAHVVSQITDGQIQGGSSTLVAKTSAAVVTQITDGQIQGGKSTMIPISQIGDGQIQAHYSAVTIKSTIVSAAPITQISDGQGQAPKTASAVTSVETIVSSVLVGASATSAAASSASSSSPSSNLTAVACKSSDTLSVTLNRGILLDNKGRTGYIASNFQFQFDKPAQAGAIYTAGWSICSNGSLALGGSTVFYECLSGDFYNLYDRYWAAQCKPVNLQAVDLQDC